MVVEGKVAGLSQPHDVQRRAHRVLAGGEHRAGDQHQDVIPGRCREEAPKRLHQRDQDRRHDGGHRG